MKLSFIVPIYNVEQFLNRCLTSILNLELKENQFEVIMVNDGSTDTSILIAEKFLVHSNFKLVNQKNKGISGARNTGLSVASGDYICFIDSDDYYHNFNMVEILEIIKIKNPDIYYFNADETAHETSLSVTKKPDLKLYGKDVFYENVSFSGHMFRMIIKRNKLINLYFDEGRLMEDIGFVIDLFMKSNTFIYDDRMLYAYYINPNSILRKLNSKEKNFKFLDDLVFAIHRIQNSLMNNNKMSKIEQETIKFKVEELFLFLFASFQEKRVSYAHMQYLDKKSGFIVFDKIFKSNFSFVLNLKVKLFNYKLFRKMYYRLLTFK